MRYSFHGKMRFTGQTVDGFIEAKNSTEAIDRLADEGVIGVYSVRPDPISTKAQLYLGGAPMPALPAPADDTAVAPMMDKLTSLIAQVEKMLSRPMMPAREGKGTKRSTAKETKYNEEQNSALRAIFQNNLDLRQSIAKLATSSAALRPIEKSAPQRESTPSRTLAVMAQPAA